MKEIKRGEIYYADLSPVVGSEEGGIRPVIVLQNDKGNLHSKTVIVAAITTAKPKPQMPTHITITGCGLREESTVRLEHIRTIDKARLKEYTGIADKTTMNRIDHAITVSFGIEYSEGLQ